MQAQPWLSTLKYYFIVVGITYIATKAADPEEACQCSVALTVGNAIR